MSTKKQFSKEEWQDKLQSLNSGNKGRVAKITVGNNTILEGIAFVSIEFDPPGKGDEMMFTVEGSTHSVSSPKELYVEEKSNGIVSVIEVVNNVGETTVLHLL